jgi:hypothetical protein
LAELVLPDNHRERDADLHRGRSRWVALVAMEEGEVMNNFDERILTELCDKVKRGELKRNDIYAEYVKIKQEAAIISPEELGHSNPNAATWQEHLWD